MTTPVASTRFIAGIYYPALENSVQGMARLPEKNHPPVAGCNQTQLLPCYYSLPAGIPFLPIVTACI